MLWNLIDPQILLIPFQPIQLRNVTGNISGRNWY